MNPCSKALTSDAIILAKAVCSYYISARGNGKKEQKVDFVRLWKNSCFQCNRLKHSKHDSSILEGCSRSDFMRSIFSKIIALGFVPWHIIAFTCTSGMSAMYLLNS